MHFRCFTRAFLAGPLGIPRILLYIRSNRVHARVSNCATTQVETFYCLKSVGLT